MATQLKVPMDVVASVKLSAPFHEGFACGAITARGHRILSTCHHQTSHPCARLILLSCAAPSDNDLIHDMRIPSQYVNDQSAEQKRLASDLEVRLDCCSLPFLLLLVWVPTPFDSTCCVEGGKRCPSRIERRLSWMKQWLLER